MMHCKNQTLPTSIDEDEYVPLVCQKGANIIGERFGKWVIIEKIDKSFVKAQCDCGFVAKKRPVDFAALRTTQCFHCRRKQIFLSQQLKKSQGF